MRGLIADLACECHAEGRPVPVLVSYNISVPIPLKERPLVRKEAQMTNLNVLLAMKLALCSISFHSPVLLRVEPKRVMRVMVGRSITLATHHISIRFSVPAAAARRFLKDTLDTCPRDHPFHCLRLEPFEISTLPLSNSCAYHGSIRVSRHRLTYSFFT
jgi:hypothetical protein